MLIDIMLYYKSLRCYIIKRKWNKGERNCTIVHYIAVALDGGADMTTTFMTNIISCTDTCNTYNIHII